MKYCISLLMFFCSISIYSQNTESVVTYDEVILDGKTAYINVTTGEIVTTKPNKLANSAVATVAAFSKVDAASNTHRVLKGETLYSIAKKHGISLAKIKELNPAIAINTLSINQRIKVGKEAKNTSANEKPLPTRYSVKKGETLYSISRKFSISIDTLKSKNNLTSTLLSIGQKLIIN